MAKAKHRNTTMDVESMMLSLHIDTKGRLVNRYLQLVLVSLSTMEPEGRTRYHMYRTAHVGGDTAQRERHVHTSAGPVRGRMVPHTIRDKRAVGRAPDSADPTQAVVGGASPRGGDTSWTAGSCSARAALGFWGSRPWSAEAYGGGGETIGTVSCISMAGSGDSACAGGVVGRTERKRYRRMLRREQQCFSRNAKRKNDRTAMIIMSSMNFENDDGLSTVTCSRGCASRRSK